MQLQGALVRDRDRAEVGRVSAILLDPQTKDARWLEVSQPDRGCALIPAAAISQPAPGELLIPYSKALIAGATHAPGAPLTAERARELRDHYGFTD